MFCYQCQEAAKGTGCEAARGVCGKTDQTSQYQDLLIHILKGISWFQQISPETAGSVKELDRFMIEGVFSTITNANFDTAVFEKMITEGLALRSAVKEALINAKIDIPAKLPDAASWTPETLAEYDIKSALVGVLATENEDVRSLRELVVYGIKGIAAYAEHADNLGYNNGSVVNFIYKGLASVLNDSLSADELVALVLECGKFGVDVMALLDEANTSTYGNPEITEVDLGVSTNPGILISGHDLKDLEELLQQTEGTGVDIYTHGEMLPAQYYPEFKKYEHLKGNYGNAWWEQTTEFASFNGPVLFTTNCIVPPKDSYKNRIYTTGASGFPGCTHIADREPGKQKDFSALIAHAKECASPTAIEEGTIVGGFAHSQVLALADKVVDAVKTGAIKRFFVMAGCDGRMKGRDYYTEFAEKLPKDTIILTAGCAKYRYNKLPLGDIGGIPRVLDAGQCNDSYSLVVIAMKLKEVFGMNDINELPISYNIAWYEQKAVIVLLALLYLGVKDIHLGPTLPAFLSPNVAKVLVETFGIAGIGEVDDDIKLFLGE
ncbi:MAG: hydroxylamine reductase [Bacteroidetes bacterium]|nr:hydroxylamine reductase [Bacteroidota bacterium]